ncbi:DUF5689 domain-containing protein [Parafilimonas terrae]|uniref:DUF5689 domain-containing protein n=1 Tax=Parafilimonas terrae TaxID=1465490 RepID=A0A1I5YHD3_9BACT|nr:DUF5689 domain-containing protein [Parafilimonas terrae]SFQ43598.1 hypothetical protein SAMN05444277_11247 [Parafilimonas terrae]
MKTSALLICIAFAIISCNKKFDEPPAYAAPNLKPTLTIAQLKAMHTTGSSESITTDDIIEGIVIANDSSGNFYKQIIIEDTTAGIAINIDDYNLYTSYPVGRNVFIKLNGLILYDDNRLIAIGSGKDGNNNINAIAAPLKNQYIIKGANNVPALPKIIDVSDLNDSYQNMLIQLTNMEFSEADTGKTYADTSASKNTVNFILKNCSNKSITLRNSGFANFAGINVPNGNGNITCIYSVYNTSRQVLIRDTSDVQFNGTRCNGGPAVQTSIANIRSMYKGHDIKLGAYKIGGVVISDAVNKNIANGNVVLQDGNAGISVYFGGTITYNIGDSIVLDVTGDSLQNYNGSLEIKTASGTIKPDPVATGKTVIPQQLSIAQLNSNLPDIEYTLIKIVNATASGGTTYSGSKTLTDASGSITLFTSSSASFANDNLPTEENDWIGFGKFFGNTKEFTIRNTTDVTTSGGNNNGDGIELTASPFTLNFDNIAAGLPQGVFVKTASSSTSVGADGVYSGNQSSWSNTSSGFKNYASATSLNAASSSTEQNASTNRALGVKQTGSTGFDPGAAFLFEINNTTGKTNISLNFLLQSLADGVGRTTTWQVDYAIGDNPNTFIPATTSPSSITTGTVFSSTPVTVNFGTALDNQNSKVWIRIVTLSATTGSGSRASTGIDDVEIKWN